MFSFTPGKMPEYKEDYYKKGFEKVSKDLKILLDDLQGLYKRMGVNYQVLILHNSLFRQLVPFELLVHLGFVDYRHLFEKQVLKNDQKDREIGNSHKYEDEEKKRNDYGEKMKIKRKKESVCKKQSLALMNLQENEYEVKSQMDYKPNDYRRLFRNSPLLTQNQELRLIDEMNMRFKNGEFVNKDLICRRAKEICGVKEFRGSNGWMTLFFKRHPQFRQRFKENSRGARGMKLSNLGIGKSLSDFNVNQNKIEGVRLGYENIDLNTDSQEMSVSGQDDRNDDIKIGQSRPIKMGQ